MRNIFKKLIAYAICISIFATLLIGESVSAYTPYISGGLVDITPVTDANGNEITAVSAGSTVTLQCDMKAGKDAQSGQSAILIAVAYKSGLVLEVKQSDLITLTSSDQLAKIADWTIPATTDSVKVFVWDTRDGRRPLATLGVVGGTVAVTDIKIDGKAINEFDTSAAAFDPATYEYDVNLAASYLSLPEIRVYTNDSLAKVEIVQDGPFPAASCSAIVKVSKGGAVVKTYTINFTQADATMNNIKIHAYNTSMAIKTVSETNSNYHAPIELKEPEGYNSTFTKENIFNTSYSSSDELNGNLPSDAINVTNQAFYTIYNISPEFYGGYVLSTLTNGYIYPMTTDTIDNLDGEPLADYAITFDINRTATVYVCGFADEQPKLEEHGWTKVKASGSQAAQVGKMNGTLADEYDGVMAVAIRIKKPITRYPLYGWYKKDFVVTEGDASTYVNIPALGGDATNRKYQFPIVKFHDSKAAVANASYKTASGGSATGTRAIANLQDYVPTTTSGSYDKILKMVAQGVPAFNASTPSVITGFADTFKGESMLSLPSTAPAEISFDLTRSARVTFMVESDSLTADWEKASGITGFDGYEYITDKPFTQRAVGADATAFEAAKSNDYSILQKEYKVKPGQVENISFTGLDDITGTCYVFIDTLY